MHLADLNVMWPDVVHTVHIGNDAVESGRCLVSCDRPSRQAPPGASLMSAPCRLLVHNATALATSLPGVAQTAKTPASTSSSPRAATPRRMCRAQRCQAPTLRRRGELAAGLGAAQQRASTPWLASGAQSGPGFPGGVAEDDEAHAAPLFAHTALLEAAVMAVTSTSLRCARQQRGALCGWYLAAVPGSPARTSARPCALPSAQP